MSEWKITFSDGLTLEGLELNGNTFFAGYELTREMFTAGRLSRVKIERVSGEGDDEANALEGEHGAMKLLSCYHAEWCGKWQLVLGEYSESELRDLKRDGDLEYIAMMTGVEL